MRRREPRSVPPPPPPTPASDGARVLAALEHTSAALAGSGVPPLSPWWRELCGRFYASETARVLVACVGRGGDKSRTAAMMAIAEVLSGAFHIPPGETHYFTHVSENRAEAEKTMYVLEAYLRLLKVGFDRSGDTLQLRDMPRGFRVLACRVGAVSGYRCIGWTADEAAKWDSDGADPAPEVLASIRAMTVTHPTARGRIISSPLATLGTFFDTWHAGDDEVQLTAHASSWLANPSITEEQTRRLERSEAKWKREYAAIPAEGHEESIYDPLLIDRATRAAVGDVPPEQGVRYVAAQDPSLGRNSWTFVIAGYRKVGGRWKASIVCARQWQAPTGAPLDPARVLEQEAQVARRYGVRRVMTDQWHGEAHASIAARLKLGIEILVDKPTPAERLQRYEGVLTRLQDDAVELPRDAHVRADLLAVRRRLTDGLNGFTISMGVTSDGRHADYAPSIVLCLWQLPRILALDAELTRRREDVGELLERLRDGTLNVETPADREKQRDAVRAAWTSPEHAESLERNKKIWDEFRRRRADRDPQPAPARRARDPFAGLDSYVSPGRHWNW
jgi:hypothetical protein